MEDEEPMDTYIVRIYRREVHAPREVLGHMEKFEVKIRREFMNLEMLLYILAGCRTDASPKGNGSPAQSVKDGPRDMVDEIPAIAEEEML